LLLVEDRYAILIDGGYAKRKLGRASHFANAEDFRVLIEAIGAHPALAGFRLHRAYYYDSQPLESAHNKPLGGSRVEFALEPVATRSRQLFERLYRLPFVALRLGELNFEGWAIKPKLLEKAEGDTLRVKHADLVPKISQKGVDMRIGMDIAALTLKKQAHIIVLVTGDSDFIPAMKFARREGAQLFLVPLGQRLRPAMHEHSDRILDIALPAKNKESEPAT